MFLVCSLSPEEKFFTGHLQLLLGVVFSDWYSCYECICAAQNYGDLRLVQNGITSSSNVRGRLEIYYNGQWGTVCDNYWSTGSTRVACRQLGFFIYSISWTTSSAGGWGFYTLQSTGLLWQRNVNHKYMRGINALSIPFVNFIYVISKLLPSTSTRR